MFVGVFVEIGSFCFNEILVILVVHFVRLKLGGKKTNILALFGDVFVRFLQILAKIINCTLNVVVIRFIFVGFALQKLILGSMVEIFLKMCTVGQTQKKFSVLRLLSLAVLARF